MKTIRTFRKNTPKINFILYLLLAVVVTGCSKDDDSGSKEIAKSSEKQITSFVFRSANTIFQTDLVATIDEENKTIDVTVPPDADVLSLLPEIMISEAATIDKTTAQNFTQPVIYMVTAEDGSTATYTITVHFPLTQRQVLQAILDVNPGNTITWDLQNTNDLNDLDGVVTNTEGKITRLSLGELSITTLPKEIGLLSELTYLYLGESQLRELSSEIGQLTNLEELHLNDNFLTSLPKEIGNLGSLLFLGLDGNSLTTLPDEINKLKNLEKLYLGANQLTAIPANISEMVNLTQLILSGNLLTELPIELCSLVNLNILDLSINDIISVPQEIGQLVHLERLLMAGNELTTIPKELGKLVNLEILSLNNNQLTSVPPEIGFLINLTTLRLSENHITSLPLSVYYIKNFHNPTMTITHDLVQLGNDTPVEALIGIYTANPDNTLGWGVDHYPEVTFHDNGTPKTITMNNKNLTRIPENINRINSLETLNANNNNLENLPSSLGSIETLAVLTLASNQLNSVPPELGQLNNLALLSITNNPLTSLPQEVCDQQISNGGILTLLTDPGEGCN
ncbi:leucine-rich repeat domain-containing protein [Maribacter polysiphoniae]|uniref:Leucine rich repeat (LRR) protein n=1 Tax=Maribacter polysiphoniae TaxID=429344 RepID=A0A316E1I6_9FLAO|nr:leucine-rich repeat domain-containing protein [Maribacter polysiphoniae]MBD1260877.1 leucine-rich repeat domain-containing protein [Maribacter polysiphoniae]PWK23985.1 leucine rich repeat (LRR) protein [Maribacter polysiphoniae]